MKGIFAILIIVFSAAPLWAQDFNLPEKYTLSKPEDYDQYEPLVLPCINWLLATPVNAETDKRMDANTFLMKWLSGTHKLTIEINPQIVTFMELNPDLVMVFMCGWTKYALETRDFKNPVNGNLKGIESVIDYYQKNKEHLERDRNVEKYIKMKEKGTMEEYVKKNVD